MTGHLRVPALDPSGTPATFSAPILRYLREELGFGGLIVTDALMMGAAVADARENPAVRALAAGCDLLCYPADPQASYEAIGEALRTGVLTQERVDEALGRYAEAVLRVSATGAGAQRVAALPPPAPLTPAVDGAAAIIADRLIGQGIVRGRGAARCAPTASSILASPLDLIVIDDDRDGAWPASPSDYVERSLRASGVALGPGGSRIVLALAEPRASKGRAGFGPASLEALRHAADADLVILFGHPRLAAEVPGEAPVLVAWHRQRLMQEAAARWIAGRLG